MDIDWKNIPEWADRIAQDPNGLFAAVGTAGYNQYYNVKECVPHPFKDEWLPTHFRTVAVRPPAIECDHLWIGCGNIEACEICNVTRKVHPEWDGNGKPPIGCLVEDRSVPGGPVYMAEVVAVEDVLVAIQRPGSLKVVDCYCLTAIKKPETAEEVYERDAKEIAAILTSCLEDGDNIFVAKVLLDCGYRKFEILEGE